jgi:hypothetical protein
MVALGAPARLMVHARRAQRGQGGRAARRVTRIAARTLVYGVAPSVVSDSLLQHRVVDALMVSHELAASALAQAVATAVYDVVVVLRVVL